LTGAPDRVLLSGLALAVSGAIAFSGKAIIVKLAYRYGVDAVTVIMYRMLFALPIFAAMGWWASRGKPPLSGRDWLGVIGLGVTGYYLSSFLDFLGLQYISASLERLILYLNPTLVLLLGWLMYGKTFHGIQLVGTAISYCGVALVFGHEARFQGGPPRCSAACWCSPAPSVTPCTWCPAASWCSAWARCGWWAWRPRWPACAACCSSSFCARSARHSTLHRR
jgi:drug/metabolite transporter (DMT)-like permease